MFVDIIKVFILSGMPLTTINKAINDVTQTSECVRVFRPSILCELCTRA